MSVDLLRASWAQAREHGDGFTAWFYARVFADHPELRPLFPPDMRTQRAHLTRTLGAVVRVAGLPEDQAGDVMGHVARLGRSHRAYGAEADHYTAVAEALTATFAHFLGDDWTDAHRQAWIDALTAVANHMIAAANEATVPPSWDATVVEVRRTGDRATVELDVPDLTPEAPDVDVAVALADTPGTWRNATLHHHEGRVWRWELAVAELPDPELLRWLHAPPGTGVRVGEHVDDIEEAD